MISSLSTQSNILQNICLVLDEIPSAFLNTVSPPSIQALNTAASPPSSLPTFQSIPLGSTDASTPLELTTPASSQQSTLSVLAPAAAGKEVVVLEQKEKVAGELEAVVVETEEDETTTVRPDDEYEYEYDEEYYDLWPDYLEEVGYT